MLNTAIHGTLDQHSDDPPNAAAGATYKTTMPVIFLARSSDVTGGISRNLSLENLPWKDVFILVYKYVYIHISLEKGIFPGGYVRFFTGRVADHCFWWECEFEAWFKVISLGWIQATIFQDLGTNEDAGIQTIPPKNSCSRLWLGRVGQGTGSRRPSDERVRSIEHKWAAKIYLT